MASKRMDLNKRCFYVLSGVSNVLGKTLAVEMCRRFQAGSVAVLIDDAEDNLQEVKKEIQFLENGVDVFCFSVESWEKADGAMFSEVLHSVSNKYSSDYFQLAFIMHNEGTGATGDLMEPQEEHLWKSYTQRNLYAPVALNCEFLKISNLKTIEKLVVNITSSFELQSFVYKSLMCSCLKARDMYFRVMADGEGKNRVYAISYSPGLLEAHKPQHDLNNNVVDLRDLDVNEKILKLPRVKPMQSTLKLINILEEMSFISRHDVDYYDTFVL